MGFSWRVAMPGRTAGDDGQESLPKTDRQTSDAVRSWLCCHVDTLDGPVHLYAYTSPSGLVVYTYQRPGCVESTFAYGSVDEVKAALMAGAQFWKLRVSA